MNISSLLSSVKRSAGFTMIELLIVISILGILAVAVLSAINPIEQINRGRDTGSRSDAEQLIGGIDRFYAFNGYYPWQTGADAAAATAKRDWVKLDNTVTDGSCSVLLKLGQGTATCPGSDELKTSFTSRIVAGTANPLYIFNGGNQGDSTYVCFIPKSKAFKAEAVKRCGVSGAGLPSDITGTARTEICKAGFEQVCLP